VIQKERAAQKKEEFVREFPELRTALNMTPHLRGGTMAENTVTLKDTIR